MQVTIRGGGEVVIMIAGRSEGMGVVGEREACACGEREACACGKRGE